MCALDNIIRVWSRKEKATIVDMSWLDYTVCQGNQENLLYFVVVEFNGLMFGNILHFYLYPNSISTFTIVTFYAADYYT